jgi:hypothetical protein
VENYSHTRRDPIGCTLTGRVVAAGGPPVPGAEVTLSWSQTAQGVANRAHRHGTADATGTFRFTQLRPGRPTLNVSAPGYARTFIDHQVGLALPTVPVTLAAGASKGRGPLGLASPIRPEWPSWDRSFTGGQIQGQAAMEAIGRAS